MSTPAWFYRNILVSAAWSTGSLIMGMTDPNAMALLMAIAGQESAWEQRIQIPGGQARGFWQCERNGMLAGVMNGFAAPRLQKLCAAFGVPYDAATIFEAIAYHDPIAYGLARCGLLMDPSSLPDAGDEEGSWACYLKNWRPGKPSRERWATIYPQALRAL